MTRSTNPTNSRQASRLLGLLFGTTWLTSSCDAAGTRGALTDATNRPRHLHDTATYQSEVEQRMAVLQGTAATATDMNCDDEVSLEIVCLESSRVCTDFSRQRGSCESKLFQYHGGPCRDDTTGTGTGMARQQPFVDPSSECLDVRGGPPAQTDTPVFIVLSDPTDPLQNSSMWATVGDYIWTDYQDYPVGHSGLGDVQNITIYSSDDASFETMLQTQLFFAPCESTALNALDKSQSVQLIGTAVDPHIQAKFEIRVSSKKADQEWHLQRVTTATSADPPYEVLDVSAQTRSLTLPSTTTTTSDDGYVSVPYSVQFNKRERLTILSTANVVNRATGAKCHVSGLWDAVPAVTQEPLFPSLTVAPSATTAPTL